MKTAVNAKEFADIEFLLGDGQSIYAHKMILTARSDYFRTIFKGGFVESEQAKVDLREIDSSIFLTLLGFIYTNEITVKSDDIVNVLLAAGRFLLDDLKQVCSSLLQTQ